MKSIIVRYGELALKAEPTRRRFEETLVKNIRLSLRGPRYALRKERGRLFIDTISKAAVKRLRWVPGIVSVSPAARTRAEIDEIKLTAVKIAKSVVGMGETFAVRTTRVGEHKFSSTDVNREVGSAILNAVPKAKVDLSAPDHEIFVEVRGNDSYVFTEVLKGVGGLPVGTQGRVLVLFSGSLDSALAAYMMMKRGCRASLLYLDPKPHGKKRARRVAAISKWLSHFDPQLKLETVPYGEMFGRILERVSKRMRCVVCKRSMLRIACAVGRRAKAEAIVLGEDSNRARELAPNLCLIDESCPIPVLRPLVGMDSSRIKRLAGQAGISGPLIPCPYRAHQGRLDLESIQRVERGLGFKDRILRM